MLILSQIIFLITSVIICIYCIKSIKDRLPCVVKTVSASFASVFLYFNISDHKIKKKKDVLFLSYQ